MRRAVYAAAIAALAAGSLSTESFWKWRAPTALAAPAARSGHPARCDERWSTTVFGLPAGSSKESFEAQADGSVRARSLFEPNAAARAVGAPSLERLARASVEGGLSWRQEWREKGGERTSSEWKSSSGGGFERLPLGAARAGAHAEPFEGLNLDSALLPRAAMLGWIEPGRARRVRVFLAGERSAMAELTLDASGRALVARSAEFEMAVELGPGSRPLSMTIRAGQASTRSELVSGGCAP